MSEHAAQSEFQGPTLLGNPHADAFTAYKTAVSIPKLTPQQERNLSDLVTQGHHANRILQEPLDENVDIEALEIMAKKGQHAEEALITHHLQLVLSIARKYSLSQDEALELAAIGNVALVEGIKRYEIREDATFTAFAIKVAHNAIIGHIVRERQKRTGITFGMQEMLKEITAAFNAALESGIAADFVEIAEGLGYEKKQVTEALRLQGIKTLSLDSPMAINGSPTLIAEQFEDNQAGADIESIPDKILTEKVWKIVYEMRNKELLSERELFIFESRFKEGLSQQVIADQIGIAQTGVSDWEEKIIAKIKHVIEKPHTLQLPEVFYPHEVEFPIHMLALLRIPVGAHDDPKPMARAIIEKAKITETQRMTLHRLLGTNGTPPITPMELAHELGISTRSVCSTRDRALENIINEHSHNDDTELTQKLKELGLPLPKEKDLKTAVYTLIEAGAATPQQREVLHRLLGTTGQAITVAELACELNITWGAARRARDRGVANILKWLLKLPGKTS